MTKKPQTTGASPKNPDTLRDTTAGEQPYIPVNITVRAKRKPRTPQLTYKQRKMVELVASGVGKKEAYRQAYDVTSVNEQALSTGAYQTLRKPLVALELAKHVDMAKSALLKVLEETERRTKGASDRDVSPLLTVAERTANSIIDRVEGKATQRVQVQSTGVVLTLDLSGYSGSLDDTTEVETEKQTDSELL